MIFGKKDKETKCENCKSGIDNKFNFCPYCGRSTMNAQDEQREFGLLGRNAFSKESQDALGGLGLTDKILNSLMNNLIKSFDKQFKESGTAGFDNIGRTDIEQLPNGIKIKIGLPQTMQNKQPKQKQSVKKQITEAQMNKMSNLPRIAAKTSVRRLSDKVIYDISAPGIESIDDVFISRLENGYEIKAIGKKKVYVNSLPINLELKGFSISDKKLVVEFKTDK